MKIRAAAAMVAVLFASGCGVPYDPVPRAVDAPGREAASETAPPSLPPGTATETLYLVKGGTIVPSQRGVATVPAPAQQLRDLLAAPSAAERKQGLTSALTGSHLGLSMTVRDGRAVIELATELGGTGRTDDIFAFAQLVCTLTSRSDIRSVTFTRAGEPVEVPRGDGSLTSGPLAFADYASLRPA